MVFVCLRVTLDALTFVWWNLLWCIFPISAVKPCFVSSQGRRVLNAVGIICILGLSSTFISLPILKNQQDIIPSGFRSRALLSTADATGIKVNYRNHKIECSIFFLCVTRLFLSVASGIYPERDYWYFHWLSIIGVVPVFQVSPDVH